MSEHTQGTITTINACTRSICAGARVLAGGTRVNEEFMSKAFEALAPTWGITYLAKSDSPSQVGRTYWDSTAEVAWLAWQAATRAAVPDGWKLVPYEPTPAMIKATGLEDDDVIADVNDLLTSAYREMLAAAPEVQP